MNILHVNFEKTLSYIVIFNFKHQKTKNIKLE